MKLLPKLTDQERDFVRDILSGMTEREAYTRSFCTEEEEKKLKSETRRDRGIALLSKPHIAQWVEYLRSTGSEQIIEDRYMDAVALGDTDDALKAAGKFLDSQFAGKEVADIFLHRLQQIQAEIVIHCRGRRESMPL